MRSAIFAFSFLAGFLALGLSSQHAEAQCTHLGNVGACPVGVSIGSTSQQFINGGILWDSGQFSQGNQCCPANGGLGTATGLFDTNFGGPGAGPGSPFEGGPTGGLFLPTDHTGALPFVPDDELTPIQRRQVGENRDRILTQSATNLHDDPEFGLQVRNLAGELRKEELEEDRAADSDEQLEEIRLKFANEVYRQQQADAPDNGRQAEENDSIMDDIESFNVGL
tara:strand:- start:6768 stop:7439 length:672 start_codon:yes stop_codon:yes gene_type:complete